MHMITGAQVRMARAIRIFEEDISIRESIILDIHSVFDAHGVEFTSDGGVKARDTSIKDFRGVGSCDRFFEYLTKTIQADGGDVVCVTDSQDLLTKATGQKRQTNLDRMEQLHKIVPIKCLLTDNKMILPSSPSFEVRVLSEAPTSWVSSAWAYAKEYTHALEFDPKFPFQHPVYMVIESPYRAQKTFEAFYARWTFAKPYPFSNKASRAA